jgi:hypothetical protein
MVKGLEDGPYKTGALVPASPWLDNTPPASPETTLTKTQDMVQVAWTHPNENDVFHWVVYARYGDAWITHILDRDARSYNLPVLQNKKSLTGMIVTAVDRTGNESLREPLLPSMRPVLF